MNNQPIHTATPANATAHSASLPANQPLGRSLGSYTFDEIGEKQISAAEADTFDENYQPVTNQPIHTV